MATSLYKFQVALKTCEEHPNEEVSCFCSSCKKFICTTCAKTTHHGHEWDFIPFVAKKRRKETPILCEKIKQENMPRCRAKLSAVDDNISDVEKACEEDVEKLEETRIAIVTTVNQIIDEQQRKRVAIKEKERTRLQKGCSQLRTDMEYLDKMTISLNSNIDAYSDFDVIEMETEMLRALADVEAYDVGVRDMAVTYIPGEVNRPLIEEMIGRIEETVEANTDDNMRVIEEKTFKEFDAIIRTISPMSRVMAYVGDNRSFDIKQLSTISMITRNIALPSDRIDFITVRNGDFVVSGYKNQVLRRVTSAGEESIILRTKPLHPTYISKTQSDDILVSLVDGGDAYKLKPSSRRLVQRMTLSGKILNAYEFREDGVTRLFIAPYRLAENGNSDICVINRFGDERGELIVLHGDGRVRATYRGQEGSAFNPRDIACDSKKRIIVLNCYKEKCLHLLSQDGTFLNYLLSGIFDYPMTMALYQDGLWIGFVEGTVKVYKYMPQ